MSAKNAQNTEDQMFNLLHVPGRKDSLLQVEEHVHDAARLSRALWTALNNPDLDLTDERDRQALVQLASTVADHASAAEVAMTSKMQD